MAVLVAILTMASLGAVTMWLPWAAGRSDAADRLIHVLGMAGQVAPLLGRETLHDVRPLTEP